MNPTIHALIQSVEVELADSFTVTDGDAPHDISVILCPLFGPCVIVMHRSKLEYLVTDAVGWLFVGATVNR